MKQNFFIALLTVSVLVLMWSVSAANAGQYGNFIYASDGTNVIIARYTGSVGTVIIPGTINGLPVTGIGIDAFSSANMESVIIGTNVTNIGEGAFSVCANLNNVTIPNNVTNIGADAFAFCDKLTSVMMSTNLVSIGELAFANTSLTNIIIPISVTNIGEAAFETCDDLTTITVDTNNPAYTSMGGVLFDKRMTTLVAYPAGAAGSYTIPDGVTNVEYRAFYFCGRLTNVTISDSVTTIGIEAFNGAHLRNVMIPGSVTDIEEGAFQQCISLTAIVVDANNPAYASVDGVLFNKEKTTLIAYPAAVAGSYAVPRSVTSIGDSAFEACFYLPSVTIPNSVTNIETGAFDQSGLTSVYFEGNEPTSVNNNALLNVGNVTVYYMAGTTGWGSTFDGVPAVLWNPQAQTSGNSFGVRTNQFGFNITGSSNLVIVVEACTNLANPVWQLVQTNMLTDGSSYFSDSRWTNYPNRFYRLRSP